VNKLLPSSSAKADDPVPDETLVRYALPVFTGSPAFAGDDSRVVIAK